MTKEELENANAKLKERNAELKGMYAHSAREAGTYKQFLEAKEKENVELKEQCSILADCNTCTSTCKTENIEMKRQLTKAKKIIKDLLGSENTCCEEEMFFEIRQKAENFLKESEVEKNEEVQD